MKAKYLFNVLLASAMLAATAGMMTACASNDDNPATPNGPSESVIKEKIVGKWKAVTQDGTERVTDKLYVMTFNADGTMTYSSSTFFQNLSKYTWRNKAPFTYSISGNVLTREGQEDGELRKAFYEVTDINDQEMQMVFTSYILDGQTFSRDMKIGYERVTADYSEDIIGMWEVTEMTGEETYNDDNARLAFLADGTYRYYRKDDTGDWQLVSTRDVEEYFVDGDWLATRWQETGGEMNYEWWDIDEIKDGQMKWSALREREDGTRFKTTFTWRKVEAPAGVEAIDLGLPSGTKWANMNIGAEKPEDYGLYFVWGETVGYGSDTNDGHSFNWASYKWCNGSYDTMTKYCTNSSYGTVDNKTVLDLEDDAAYVNWSNSWRMPTITEIDELLNNTTSEWTTVNGVNGRKFTSTMNGNSIFLPAAGYRYGSYLDYQTSGGYYWSSSLSESNPSDARSLDFGSGSAYTGSDYRFLGFTVRPVQ